MEKISIPWKAVRGTWNTSLLKNVKDFEKMNYEAALKNGRRQWNKMVNMLFNKVLGKNQKCLLFLLESQRNLLANPMFCKFNDTEFIVVFNLFFLKVEQADILNSYVSMRIKYGKQMGKQ